MHHAYIIEGERGTVIRRLAAFFENELGIILANNPDYLCERFDTFGIDEARMLKERQSRLSVAEANDDAVGAGRKFFVVCAERVTVEAQNALLKTLEEPTAGTHIFIVVPSAARILPTVRSRARMLTLVSPSVTKAREFLAAQQYERERYCHAIVENQDRTGAFSLIQEIESAIRIRFRQSGDAAEYYTAINALERCREHLGGRAPSLKMLLEYLAIALPRVSE